MAEGSKPCGAETFSHIAKLVAMTRFFYGVHCGTTILRSIDDAVQRIEQPLDFIQYLLHLFFLLRDFDCSNYKCRWLLGRPRTARQ
jgi:hypothetical protein